MRTKRTAYVLLALLIAGSSANAAMFTSSQNGNFSSAATWGGAGVPGVGDDITVNHNVLFDDPATDRFNDAYISSTGTLTAGGDSYNRCNRLILDGGTFDVAGFDVQTAGNDWPLWVRQPDSVVTDSMDGGRLWGGNAGYKIDSSGDLLLQAVVEYPFELWGDLLIDADAGGRLWRTVGGAVAWKGGTLTLDHDNLSLAEEIVTLKMAGDQVATLNSKITSGELEIINGVYEIDFDGTHTTVTAVPEPSALVVLGLGLVGLAVRRRRKQMSKTDQRDRTIG